MIDEQENVFFTNKIIINIKKTLNEWVIERMNIEWIDWNEKTYQENEWEGIAWLCE